jgi:metal-sulfur cluster biosynthetic enzyme
MSTWNYRVMKKLNEQGEYEFGIYEVHYDDNDKVISHTMDPITPVCPSAEKLEEEIEIMKKAFKLDILNYE